MLRKAASLIVVPLLLLLWARLGAQSLTEFSFNAIANYPSPYLAPIAPGEDGEAVSRQVVIVVVDALRADASRTMPALNALRDQGADRIAQAGQPSFSLPGWTVIGTGAWQEQSGVTLNYYSEEIKVETIFEAAKRKGLTTALVGVGKGWSQLYSRGVDSIGSFNEPENPEANLPAVRRVDDQIEVAALKILSEKKPDLMFIHFGETDEAGHAKGGTSAEYKSAVAAEDARIARLVAVLNLSEGTIIVTSDHGMLDRGGHGGWEPQVLTTPLVAAGKGIKPGEYTQVTQADIAPTVAVLLGTSIPAHNQGTPLFDILDIPANLRAQRAVDAAQQIADRYAQIAKVLAASKFDHKKLAEAKQALASGDADGAFQAALADVASTGMQAAAAKDARFLRERLVRLPMALLILLPFILYVVILLRAKWDWRVPVTGMVTYLIVYNGLFFIKGNTWSLSVFNKEEDLLAFFTARTIDAMIALLIASIVVGVLSRRRTVYETALNMINVAFFVTWAVALQILIFYVLFDISFAWYIPDLLFGFKYYLDVLQTGAFWPLLHVPLLVVLPFIALGARWMAAKAPSLKWQRPSAAQN